MIAQDDDGGINLNPRISYIAGSTDQTVFLSVREYARDNAGSYLVVVTQPPDQPSANNFSSAANLRVDNSRTNHITFRGDQDWYRTVLKAGSSYRFYFWPSTLAIQRGRAGTGSGGTRLNAPLGNGNGYMRLYDSDGTTLIREGQGFIGTAVVFYFQAPGNPGDPDVVRYIRIHARSWITSGHYTVGLSGIPGLDDYGNTDSTAALLNLRGVPGSGAINGGIEVRNDKDWFRVELRNAGTYNIRLEGNPDFPGATLQATILRLFDSGGTLLQTVNLGSGGVREINGLNPSGVFGTTTYYIEAGALNHLRGVGLYRLTVSEQ